MSTVVECEVWGINSVFPPLCLLIQNGKGGSWRSAGSCQRAGGEEGNTANIPVLVLGSSISNGLSRQRGNSCKGCAHNPINLPAPEGSPAIRAASEAWVENPTEEGEGRGDVFRTIYELCWKYSSTCSFIWQGSVLSLQLHRVVLLHIVWDLINFCRIFSSCALITLI